MNFHDRLCEIFNTQCTYICNFPNLQVDHIQGIFCSGLAYYIQGIVMKDRGPVFVTAFSPLGMVIVAIMSSFILQEKMFLGR